MSTTTVGDLLDSAEILARSLRLSDTEISANQWHSFDATAYRLLRELVGPERITTGSRVVSHGALSRAVDAFPSPHGSSKPPIAAVEPADPTSTHTLDRLTCTLGVLADIVVAERTRTTHIAGFDPLRDDGQVAPVMARVFAITLATARHTLAHIPLQDATRPLTIAQYAEHRLDSLGDIDRPSGLDRVASFAPSASPHGPNEILESALRTWASHARTELARSVPSTEVLRNIANQARHLYAVSTRLVAASFTAGHLSEEAGQVVRVDLREAAQVMHALQQQWETVTTATRPSHEYVTATTTLHSSLSAIERESLPPGDKTDAAGRIDVDQALADLRYAATDLVELTHTGARLPEPLIRSEVLFAPARILPSTMERVYDRNHGRYVAIQLSEGAALIAAAQEGSGAARHAQATLEVTLRPAATTGLFTQPTFAKIARQELEPATGFGGPDLL